MKPLCHSGAGKSRTGDRSRDNRGRVIGRADKSRFWCGAVLFIEVIVYEE
jgi:hypothetical protein